MKFPANQLNKDNIIIIIIIITITIVIIITLWVIVNLCPENLDRKSVNVSRSY